MDVVRTACNRGVHRRACVRDRRVRSDQVPRAGPRLGVDGFVVYGSDAWRRGLVYLCRTQLADFADEITAFCSR